MQPPLHAALITTLALAGCFVDPGVGEGGTGEASGAASTGSSSASATQGGTSAATTSATATATSGATDTVDTSADTTAGADLPGLCGLPVGAFTFGAAVHLAALSSAGMDSDPIFWGDLRLYFSSRPDTNVEIFVTTRASLRGAFGEPALASDLGLNGSTADAHPHLSVDGLRVVFATDREGGARPERHLVQRAPGRQPALPCRQAAAGDQFDAPRLRPLALGGRPPPLLQHRRRRGHLEDPAGHPRIHHRGLPDGRRHPRARRRPRRLPLPHR